MYIHSSRVVLQKGEVIELVEKFLAFMATEISLTLFTKPSLAPFPEHGESLSHI